MSPANNNIQALNGIFKGQSDFGRSTERSPTCPPKLRAKEDATVGRIRFPSADGFETARQAWAGCGRAARSAIPVYAQARKARRRLKIAAAFFEPNSSTLEAENKTKKQTIIIGVLS